MPLDLTIRHLRFAAATIAAARLLAILLLPARAQNAGEPALPPPAPAATAPATPAPQPAPAPAAAPAATGPAEPGAVPAAARAAAPKPKPKPKPAPPREMALSDDPTPALQPETFFATSLASERYAAIADAGGWPKIGTTLAPGARGKVVAALRKRLTAEGDLPAEAAGGEAWDAALTAAVKHFQFRMGLKQTGVVAGATLRELDVPASVRFRQLASSAQRLAGNDFPFGPRYVVVNIPSAAVDAVENGRVARRYTAIVGDVEHPSPEVEAKIGAVNLNPTWTVPVSIIKNEIMPKMQKDPSYLAKARIRVFDNRGTEIEPKSINWANERAANYTLRQDSGAQNSLGSIRIAMPNKHAVYMHDTPSKRLFASDYRFLSHGCVRVEGVYDLAAWLLEGAPGAPNGQWDKPAIMAKIAGGERQDVTLQKPVPVVWVYMTGWASANGTVHFRNDIYGVDAVGEARGDR
ncbi:murein L,D-transpeptidase [Methylosinus sp. Ce-a6]|uniref:L,D-transpeptidase family protein n=1 Tax=Methylosinus sp. Ce-a6 TaxID=2172005 RepID=UPI001FCEDAD6|nr:L,D-transpeptidase family protein [Methylosinus sp. Ce-a6]